MCRLTSSFLALLISASACLVAVAQSPSKVIVAEIQVRVAYSNERPAGQHIRVELLNDQSVPVNQGFTDMEGRVVFHVTNNDGAGYKVRASVPQIGEVYSDRIVLAPGDRMAMAWVHLPQAKEEATQVSTKSSNATSTSANELRVPADAKRFFLKGMDALYRHDFPKAAEAFEKAVATYPQYDSAYDNLGVAYTMLGQSGKARAAFERAVELNDKNAEADRNYARVLLSSNEYPRAIEVLNKALTVQPLDPNTLTLISMAQLRTGDVDVALQNALKVHQVSHESHALAHYIAGRAYEVKPDYQKATVEYQTYLRESPEGPEARQVRAALSRVTTSAKSTPQGGATPQ
jgi:tetratricopeptide (TPR) repeat protein